MKMVDFKKVFIALIAAGAAELIIILTMYCSFEGVTNQKDMFNNYLASDDYETAESIYFVSRDDSEFKTYADSKIKDKTNRELNSLSNKNLNKIKKLNSFLKDIKRNDLSGKVDQKLSSLSGSK